jgi:hypothetical protein
MICPQCSGVRRVAASLLNIIGGRGGAEVWIVCPYCDGQGTVHCCEGEISQPEEEKYGLE